MPVTAVPSLRYRLILNSAVREYDDGRQVCCDTPKGKMEYRLRTERMRLRQHNICSRGPHLIQVPTFDHSTNGRGMGASRRDDRIVDIEGNWLNSCSCLKCNSEAGSRRL